MNNVPGDDTQAVGIVVRINLKTKYLVITQIIITTIIVVIAYFSVHIFNAEGRLTPEKQDFDVLISKDNNFKIYNSNIEINFSSNCSIIKIPDYFFNKYSLKNISINDEILSSDLSNAFYTSNLNGFTFININEKIKPSTNKLSFIFNNIKYDYKLILVYNNIDSIINNEFWYENPKGWVKKTNDTLILSNKYNNVNSLGFRRRYEDNVEISFDLIPNKSPLNLSIYFGQGTSIYIGLHDDRTIHFVQTKKIKNIDKYITRIKTYYIFKENKKIRLIARKSKDEYSLTILRDGKIYHDSKFIDITPNITVNEKFNNVGLALWKDSEGASVSNITIRSNENI